jgi:type IV pilus assembly protein PilO
MEQLKKILEKIPYDRIAAFPAYQRWIVILVIQILIFTAYYFLIQRSKAEEISRLNGELSNLQQEIVKSSEVAKRLPALEKEIENIDTQLAIARAHLPEEKEIPGLLTSISNLAMQSGLDILVFKPGVESRKDFYAEVPVQIKTNGGFHNTLEFFDKVSKMPRIVTISNVKMGNAREEKGRTVIEMDCFATTFRYMEKPPEQKVEKK